MKQARMLKASNAPPSTEEIAQLNIILFSSIALVIICYFSMMAMVNMVRFASPRLRLALLSRPALIVNLVARYLRRILAATRCFTLSRSPTEFDALSCARSAVLAAPQRADRCLFFATEGEQTARWCWSVSCGRPCDVITPRPVAFGVMMSPNYLPVALRWGSRRVGPDRTVHGRVIGRVGSGPPLHPPRSVCLV